MGFCLNCFPIYFAVFVCAEGFVMRILLVSPEVPDTFWSLKTALRFASKKGMLPPLGLLTVASMLPDDWEPKLVDMSVTSLTDSDILWADYVFLSGMYIQKDCVDGIIERCHGLGSKIVGGGPIFTAVPEDYCHVDHLVLGEAEVTLPAFLADVQNGSAKHIYRPDEWAKVSETPIPQWDLIDKQDYYIMGVQYSRGCPFGCDFCNVTTLFGNRMRTKTAEQMIAELDSLYAMGWRESVFIVDDNFIGNKGRLKKEVLPAMIEWMEERGRPFKFNTQVSINLADDEELMELMADAGFDCVFVGIETADEASLSECNKLQNKGRDLVGCVKKIQSFGMEVQGGFILGFDSDHVTVFENLIRFIQDSGIVTAMVGLLNAPMGTELYDRMLDEDRLLKYPTGDNTDLSINFVPKMNLKELQEGYKKVVATIYSPEQFYKRVLTFFKSYVPFERQKRKVSIGDIKALFKSMWFIGVLDAGRGYYWKLIFKSIRHPGRLGLIISFAIYGFHFRRVFANCTRV